MQTINMDDIQYYPSSMISLQVRYMIVTGPVSVTDPRGQFVYGLTSSDFALLDDGISRSVKVDYFRIVAT
jgi:hypothetical protein